MYKSKNPYKSIPEKQFLSTVMEAEEDSTINDINLNSSDKQINWVVYKITLFVSVCFAMSVVLLLSYGHINTSKSLQSSTVTLMKYSSQQDLEHGQDLQNSGHGQYKACLSSCDQYGCTILVSFL